MHKPNTIKGEPKLNKNERLWTFDEGMEFLGIRKSSLYAMIAREEIPCLRVNNKVRFIPEQLWAWAKKKSNHGRKNAG